MSEASGGRGHLLPSILQKGAGAGGCCPSDPAQKGELPVERR